MVETAIAVLLFSVCVLGTIDMARAVWTRSQLGYAAATAARYASLHGRDSGQAATPAAIRSYISREAIALRPEQLTLSANWTPDNTRGSVVRIDLQYDFHLVTPLLPFSSIALSRSARRVVIN